MNTFEKAELGFSNPGMPIYNSKVPGTTGRKTGRRWRVRTKAIVKRFAFHANAITEPRLSLDKKLLLYIPLFSSATAFSEYIIIKSLAGFQALF